MAFPFQAVAGLAGALLGGGNRTPSTQGPIPIRRAPSPLTAPQGFIGFSRRPIENQADYDRAIEYLSIQPDVPGGLQAAVEGLRANAHNSAADLLQQTIATMAQPLMGSDETAAEFKPSDVIRHLRSPYALRAASQGSEMLDEALEGVRKPGLGQQAFARVRPEALSNLMPTEADASTLAGMTTVGRERFRALSDDVGKVRRPSVTPPVRQPAIGDTQAPVTPFARRSAPEAPPVSRRLPDVRPTPGGVTDPAVGGFSQRQGVVDRIRNGTFTADDVNDVMRTLF